MIMDKQNLFSDQQSLISGTGNLLATNSMDLGIPGATVIGGTVTRDFGRGQAPKLMVQITETVTGGATTVQAQVIQGTGVDGNGQINAGLEVVSETAAIAVATLKAGYSFNLELPRGITQRYLSVRYVIGGAAVTAGKATAGLVFDRQD